MAGELSPLQSSIPIVANASDRETRYPPASRIQNQRVFRLDTQNQERWNGSLWIIDFSTNTVFNVKNFGADATGSSDSTSAFLAAVTAAGVGGTIYAPMGSYKVTNLTLPNSGVTIRGDGDGTIITVGANNSVIFQWGAGVSNICIRDAHLVGDGTTSSAINGCAVLFNGGGFRMIDVLATNFGFGVVVGNASATQVQGPKIVRLRSINNGNASTGGTDVYMGGGWYDSEILDCTFSTTNAYGAVFFYDLNPYVWNGVQIRGGSVQGYVHYSVVGDDETTDGSETRVYGYLVDGVSFRNIGWQAVKVKNSSGIRIVNNVFDNCAQNAENGPSGLEGTIQTNSLGRVVIANNVIRNSGCSGIKVFGSPPNTYPIADPSGKGSKQFLVTGNVIDGAGVTQSTYGVGISVLDGNHGCVVENNTIRNFTVTGILIQGSTQGRMVDAGVFNNSILDSGTAATNAYVITQVENVRVNGNIAKNAGINMANFNQCATVLVGSTEMMMDPTTGPGARGYSFTDVNDLVFAGKAGNNSYTAWVATTVYAIGALVRNGNYVYQCVIGGTSAGSGGPTATSGAQVDGTVTWFYFCFYNGMSTAMNFGGTIGTVTIADTADFKGNNGTSFSGIPASYRRTNSVTGTSTFATAATVAVSFTSPGQTETDALYKVSMAGSANETVWVTSKATTGFTINSSNATSVAKVDWVVYR